MFAIVDIETTGGHAAANGITEIAIVLHDGKKIEGKYQTLINPNAPISRFVQSLTGITPDMVAHAPMFDEVASKIFNLLHDRVFVAHNVNFDHSFVKYHLKAAGFDLNVQKLCTIRAARKVFPNLSRYGLDNVCMELNIPNDSRHRAAGDAMATTKLLELLFEHDTKGELHKMFKAKSREQYLPPNLAQDKIAELPYSPGVYYFHDKKGKVIYVGKAKVLRHRVTNHFSNNKVNKQKQDFLRKVYDISYKICGTELMASILESIEIRRLWPELNHSQKRFEQVYALYVFDDANGYSRLAIEKKKKHLTALYTFGLITEGRQMVKKLIDKFDLCPKLCFLDLSDGPTLVQHRGELPGDYNKRVQAAISYLEDQLPSFLIMEDDIDENEASCILVEKGRFAGMGKVPQKTELNSTEAVKPYLEAYPENAFIRNLVYQYAGQYPERKVDL
jgi:DNA polymerase-3 subunit epsilon